jgi:hypothetical protein
MTGPEHYREAEQLLGARRSGESADDAASRLAEAPIHATLALAAATAADSPAWQQTIGKPPPPEIRPADPPPQFMRDLQRRQRPRDFPRCGSVTQP